MKKIIFLFHNSSRSGRCAAYAAARRQPCGGMTLIELMTTIAVMAIVLTFGVPSLATFLKNTRLTTATTEIQGAFNQARSEAVMRRLAVSVCASTNGSDCSTSGLWQGGLLVFTNGAVGDTPGTVSENDQPLKYVQFTDTALTVTPVISSASATPGFGSNNNTYVRFNPSGMVDNAGALLLCDDRSGAFGHQVTIWSVGRTEATSKVQCPASASS